MNRDTLVRVPSQREVAQFRALAHPIRLGMVRQLAEKSEICACDFGDAFSVSQPTISDHLRVLRQAGLVVTRRDGTSICYSLVPEAIESLVGLVAELRAPA
jgi:ArsR family transcriptional regulator, arsenate/arsenite/antimonite-responsive transcriptional repressor